MNLRIITKNHADDSKIGSHLKIDFKAEWTHEFMPTVWVLKTSPHMMSCRVSEVGFVKTRLLHLGNVEKSPHPQISAQRAPES